MPLTIEHIQEAMAGEGLSPRQVVDFRVYLAALFSMKTDELQAIYSRRPEWWNNNRPKFKSDKATDRAWEATSIGVREMQLEMLLKRIDKLSSALASKLRVLEMEARNQV